MNKKVFISFVTGLYRAVKLGACIFFLFFCREICERSVKACTARSNYCRTCILGCSQLLQGRKSLGENTNVEFVIQFLFVFTGVRGQCHIGVYKITSQRVVPEVVVAETAVGDVIRFQRHRFCIFASRGLGDLNGAVRGPLSVRCGQEVQTRPGQCRTFNLQFACSVYLSMHPCTFVWNKLCYEGCACIFIPES